MKFTVLASPAPKEDGIASSERKVFFFDNATNVISDDTGRVYGGRKEHDPSHPSCDHADHTNPAPASEVFSPDSPFGKSVRVKILKIQMGLSCNYSCEYCSQRFVPRAEETAPRDVERFMSMLQNLKFTESDGLKVEFWGGEPFVYWKTFKPLAEAMRDYFDSWKKEPRFSVITNGSLLTREINDWLVMMGFFVGISHDGPGQRVRGPDPLDDPPTKAAILNLYKRLQPMGRISFNYMLNRENQSRLAAKQFFVDLTGDPFVPLGEGGLIDAYDEGGLAMALKGRDEHAAYRRTAFNEIFSTNGVINNYGVIEKVDGFIRDALNHTPSAVHGQKCGMDDEHVLAVDLRGNVLTCQNVSAVATAPNGRPHLSGHMTKMDKVRVHSSTHWANRPECSKCPVVSICKGSCMYLEGERWDVSCDHAYSDGIAAFALAFEKITGYVPVLIEAEDGSLRQDRADIWGTASSLTDDISRLPKPAKETVNA